MSHVQEETNEQALLFHIDEDNQNNGEQQIDGVV